MTNDQLVKSVGIDRVEAAIPQLEIAERVLRGEVIVIPQCLQAIGYFDLLRETSLAGIERVVGAEQAAKVRFCGFEALHTIVDVDKLTVIVGYSYQIYRELASELAQAVVEKVFQTKKPFYYEEEPNVRYHVPYDVAVQRQEELSNFDWSGKITAHCPHHDSWYDCPTNSINVWFALGAVKRGNGLCLYPRVYGKRLPCNPDGKIARQQYYGEGLNFELEPGDAVIFHGEHLHSSEINSTDKTRHGISLRLTLDKPQFISPSPYTFVYSGFGGKLQAKLSRLRVKVTDKLDKILPKAGDRPPADRQVTAFDDTSASFPSVLPVEQLDRDRLIFDSAELPVGTIRPISPKLCVARLNDKQASVFSRYCPHEGADLAAGYLQNGQLVCPWHNLPFNLADGASPCRSLARLTVWDYQQNDDTGKWQLMETNR
jgi:nitrite reductase/ring-hydroxylating ferredoxin subunit